MNFVIQKMWKFVVSCADPQNLPEQLKTVILSFLE